MKKKGYVLRKFKDAGTGENYTPGPEPVMFEEGAFLNYKAAGLVSAEAPKTAAKAPEGGATA